MKNTSRNHINLMAITYNSYIYIYKTKNVTRAKKKKHLPVHTKEYIGCWLHELSIANLNFFFCKILPLTVQIVFFFISSLHIFFLNGNIMWRAYKNGMVLRW